MFHMYQKRYKSNYSHRSEKLNENIMVHRAEKIVFIDTAAITAAFPHVPNLEIRDRTVPEIDLWSNMGEDTLEGVYFRLLHDAMADGSEKLQQNIKLAAKISRQILDGQEVTLP